MAKCMEALHNFLSFRHSLRNVVHISVSSLVSHHLILFIIFGIHWTQQRIFVCKKHEVRQRGPKNTTKKKEMRVPLFSDNTTKFNLCKRKKEVEKIIFRKHKINFGQSEKIQEKTIKRACFHCFALSFTCMQCFICLFPMRFMDGWVRPKKTQINYY